MDGVWRLETTVARHSVQDASLATDPSSQHPLKMFLMRRKAWTIQPQYPAEKDPRNTITRGILADINLAIDPRLNGKFPTTQTGTQVVRPMGCAIKYNGAQKTQYAVDAAFANACVTTAGCSVLVVFDCDALTNYGGLVALQDGPSTRNAFEVRIGK